MRRQSSAVVASGFSQKTGFFASIGLSVCLLPTIIRILQNPTLRR